MKKSETPDYNKIGVLLNEFLERYALKPAEMSDEEFLKKMLARKISGVSEKKIDAMCREIFESDKQFSDFIEEAKTSPAYENATQSWFYEKIKKSLDKGDYDLVERLSLQNEILDTVNRNAIQISRNFQKSNGFKHSEEDDNDIITSEWAKTFSDKTKINSARSASVHRTAFDTGVKRSFLTQYKRMLQLDFSNLNTRADFFGLAENLSRNAAMTGICGMMLTSGLSVLFAKTVVKKSILKIAFKAGTTDSLRVVVTGALKVGAEKRMLPLLTHNTPMIVLTAVALVAVESSKHMLQYVNGQVKCLETLNQISKVSASAICAVTIGIQGAVVGGSAFAAIPVAGPVAGAFIGELVGTMAGYEIGQISYQKLKTLIFQTHDILTANYGFFEMLSGETVYAAKKRKRVPNLT